MGVLFSSASSAAITVYMDEAAYLADLALLYANLSEDFEADTAWGDVRSSIVGFNTAPSVSNNGLTWRSNYDSGEITTANFTVHSGVWAFNAVPHGSFDRTDIDCSIPGNCGDGFIGSVAAPALLYGIGGWFKTTTPPAKLGLFLDGVAVDFGNTCDTSGENCVNNSELTTLYKFFGVIDTAGFSSFEYRELEGTALEPKSIFADAFNLAALDSDGDTVVDIADAFPFDPTEWQDSDSDGAGDNSDNCTLVANGPLITDKGGNSQLDTDGDGYGNICDPDYNNDLIVNFDDLANMKSFFFKANPDVDLNGDGIVNFADLAIVKTMFFGAPGPSGLVP